MNKFLCSLVFVLSFSSVHAQSNDSQKEIQTLVQRVDSLEHELSYLKLTYELNTLNSDITMFANEVYTKSIAIQLDLYNRNFNISGLLDEEKVDIGNVKVDIESILSKKRRRFLGKNNGSYP